jgi:hypothetical protein
MARGAFEETRFDQTPFPVFIAAFPLVGAVLFGAVLLSVGGLPPLLLWGLLGVIAAGDIGISVYFYRLSQSPGYIIVRHDELVVKPPLRSQEDVYSYRDLLYFECRLTSASRSTYWQTTGIRRDPPGRVKLPLFGSNQATKRGGIVAEDNRDIQVFRLVKEALENWQREQGVVVEPRPADRRRDVLT